MRVCILAFSLVFTAYLTNAVVSGKNFHCIFQARVVLKPLLLLVGRLVLRSARITSGQTDRQTESIATLAVHARRGFNYKVNSGHLTRAANSNILRVITVVLVVSRAWTVCHIELLSSTLHFTQHYKTRTLHVNDSYSSFGHYKTGTLHSRFVHLNRHYIQGLYINRLASVFMHTVTIES